MSILFSHFLSNHNEILPQEADFTEVLTTIALTPKKLYFYGKMPENRVLSEASESGITEVDEGIKELNSGAKVNFKSKFVDNVVKNTTKAEKSLKSDSENTAATNNVANSTTKSSEKSFAQYLEPGQKSPCQRPKTVAIVGTRKPTDYGTNIARKLAYECAKRGVVVVSGLAYGIDSIAHRGALEAGGVTIGVLGTPIDQIYPRAHEQLAAEIIETGGCIMSELAPGAKFYPKTSFLERNRIISGLADVVVVVEAAERSGSLNTAAHALEQGKEVLAVPADITRPMSQGCNRLIRQGAMPYLGPEDVLDLLFPPQRKRRRTAVQVPLIAGDTAEETVILRAISGGLSEGEAILASTGLEAAKFRQNLTMLEIKGRVVALGMNRWGLK